MAEWIPSARRSLASCLLAVSALVARPAPGQPEPDPDPGTAPGGEVEISVESFGAAMTARVGELTGLRLALTDGADRPREVVVSIAIRDGDGDTILYQDSLATNPGARQPVWLYPRLPFSFTSASVLTVTVHAAEEITPAPRNPSLPHYAPGRLLGLTRIPAPQRLLPSNVGMIGVLGRRAMGLAAYEGDPGRDHLLSGHERSEVVPLDIAGMPDRWFGLAQFDVIAWGDGQPGQLTPEAAHALREWVRRGGHLVVVMPRVGQTWTDPATNPLHDITPDVTVQRLENVDLGDFEPIIRLPDKSRPLPAKETLHVFAPPGGEAWTEGTNPIFNDREGRCIAVRRLEGIGAVTLIGLDLSARFFADHSLPRPELFWHRILGRRGVQMSAADFAQRPDGSFPMLGEPARDNYTLDRDFGAQIDKKEQAAAGVLIGFVVFVAYWLVAGPIGFFVLRRYGYAHHAWPAFLAAAVLFTGIAWGGAAAIRPSRVRAFHLTFLDHVYGQDWQRARAWVNVLVPMYGDAGISVGDPAQRADAPAAFDDRVHNAIVPWEPAGSSAGGGFPDSRAYPIESRSPEAMRFPARSTVKQFEVEWAGGPAWQMPTPLTGIGPDDRPELQLVPRADRQPLVRGVLRHGLPGPLEDITLIVVRGQRSLHPSHYNPNSQSVDVWADVVIYKHSHWAPGDPWDLSTIAQTNSDTKDTYEFLQNLVGSMPQSDDTGAPGRTDQGNLSMRMTAISLFSQLAPPELGRGMRQQVAPLAIRRLTHGLDLGRWFTQPCVIVIGILGKDGEQASPVPIYVDTGGGPRPAPTAGRTVVRWVYPLPAAPPAYPPKADRDDEEPPPG